MSNLRRQCGATPVWAPVLGTRRTATRRVISLTSSIFLYVAITMSVALTPASRVPWQGCSGAPGLRALLDAGSGTANDPPSLTEAMDLLVESILPPLASESTPAGAVAASCRQVTAVFRLVSIEPAQGAGGSAELPADTLHYASQSAARAVLCAVSRHSVQNDVQTAGWEALSAIFASRAAAAALEPWWCGGADGLERAICAALASRALGTDAKLRACSALAAVLAAYGGARARGRAFSAGCLEHCLALLEEFVAGTSHERPFPFPAGGAADDAAPLGSPGEAAEAVVGGILRLTVAEEDRTAGSLWRTIGLRLSERCTAALAAALERFPGRPLLAEEAARLLGAMVQAGPRAAAALGPRAAAAVVAALAAPGVQSDTRAIRSCLAALRLAGASAGASAPRALDASLDQARLHSSNPETLAAALSASAALLGPGPNLRPLSAERYAASAFEAAAAALERPDAELPVCVAAARVLLALAEADEEGVMRRARQLPGSLVMSLQEALNRHLSRAEMDPGDPESFAAVGRRLLAALGITWDYRDALANALKRRTSRAAPASPIRGAQRVTEAQPGNRGDTGVLAGDGQATGHAPHSVAVVLPGAQRQQPPTEGPLGGVAAVCDEDRLSCVLCGGAPREMVRGEPSEPSPI